MTYGKTHVFPEVQKEVRKELQVQVGKGEKNAAGFIPDIHPKMLLKVSERIQFQNYLMERSQVYSQDLLFNISTGFAMTFELQLWGPSIPVDLSSEISLHRLWSIPLISHDSKTQTCPPRIGQEPDGDPVCRRERLEELYMVKVTQA